MAKLVTLVNSNQVKPAVAPIAFDYLFEPLVRAGFRVDLLDLCFSTDFKADIARYCQRQRPDFWGVTMRNTDDVYFSSQHSFVDKVRDIVQSLREQCPVPITMGGVGFSIMPELILEHCGADFGLPESRSTLYSGRLDDWPWKKRHVCLDWLLLFQTNAP
jgi:hypothetical protein